MQQSSLESSLRVLSEHLRGINDSLSEASSLLQAEFRESVGTSSGQSDDPLALLCRIRAVLNELPSVEEQCESLVREKDVVIRNTATDLLRNRAALNKLAVNIGMEPSRGNEATAVLELSAQWYRETSDALSCAVVISTIFTLVATFARPSELDLLAVKVSPAPQAILAQVQEKQTESQTCTPSQPFLHTERSSHHFANITAEEFARVPSSTKGRITLEAVNNAYASIFECAQNKKHEEYRIIMTFFNAIRFVTAAELDKVGCTITGISGEAKLATLRSLNIIERSKKGIKLRD